MFNKALIAAATAAFISASAAPVTQAEAGSLNFSVSFGKSKFKKTFKRRASLRRVKTNRGSRKSTRSSSAKCASGLKVSGRCMSKSYKRQLEAANKQANKNRLYKRQMWLCKEAAVVKHTDTRLRNNAMARCVASVEKRFN